ncbi:hypothetical protein D5086_000549 [Populus alba]|uniref:Uncharacterized protein n=1 Tax=Populus alba TaxID=43335 RepID=A0ACC4CWX2_POPAL
MFSSGHERWFCHGRVSIGGDEWVLVESRSCIQFNSLDQATAVGPSILQLLEPIMKHGLCRKFHLPDKPA